jgi:hypothetical protein
MEKISLPLLTLYSDLTQRVHSRPARPGSTFTMKVKGREYVYVKRLVGKVRRDDYVGPAHDPDTAAAANIIQQTQREAQQDRKTIRLLIRSGIPAPVPQLGRVLDVLSDAGLFQEAILVGTAAYQCYSPVVGHALPSPTLMTGDADLAVARLAFTTLPDGETLLDVLRRAEPTFAPVPPLSRPNAPSSTFRTAKGFIVDLVTQQRTRDDPNPMPIEGAEAGAVPLQFIRWLIADPIPAIVLFGNGVTVTIPQPSRYAVHKLIIAQLRRGDQRLKRQKDLLQAKALIKALKVSDPYALEDALDDARGQGKKGWSVRIDRSLNELELDPDHR